MNASQASSHFPLSPISAATLLTAEVERRNQLRQLGPCKTGCRDVDEYVLLGGLERGSVVGVSAEEESTGLCLGMQILSREVVGRREAKALVITPRPAAAVLGSLRESIQAELDQSQSQSQSHAAAAAAATSSIAKNGHLDQVLLSQVFDMDGVWEVLSDLEPEGGGDDGDLPSVVVITHFSSLLTGLFAQRARPAAMQNLALLAAHMRHLTRTLASQPLILLLNTTATGETQTQTQTTTGALDPSLRSIFNPPRIDGAGYTNGSNIAAAAGGTWRRNKPSFGLVFTQLLDLHLVCWRLARTPAELPGDEVTVVEVLQDDLGLWQGKSGARPIREQRWTAVDVVRGRVLDAVLTDEDKMPRRGGGATGHIVTSGGFGGRRP